MKTRCTVALGELADLGSAAAVNSPAEWADNQSPIVGTWQLTSLSAELLDTKEVVRPFDRVTGYLQYSPGGHMVTFLARADLHQPATSAYTDAERVEIHKGIIGAYAGTYRIEGNKITHHVLTAWQPEWIGGDQIRYFEMNDKNLTIKTAPIKVNRYSGRDIVGTLTFVRVE
jgi:hypothetical protein